MQKISSNHDTKKEQFTWFIRRYGCWIIISITAFVIIITFDDYGITWDESLQAKYGELVLRYFTSGFQDQSCNRFVPDINLYGPLFEAVCAFIYTMTGFAKFEVRHLLIAFCLPLTILAVFKTGRLFDKPLVPVFAAISLLMMPRFYGHAFNNSKDIPLACAFSWAMLAVCALLTSDKNNWRSFIISGVAVGIALSIRIGAFLLFFYIVAGVIMALLTNQPCVRIKPYTAGFITLAGKLVVLALIAWMIMVLFWPWMHQNPLINPIRGFMSTVKFENTYPILFEGKVLHSDQLPWHYLPKYLLISTPPVLLFFFVCGIVAMVKNLIVRLKSHETFLIVMTQLWFFFPIIYVIYTRPNIYDGIRHFLFILPAFALVSGYGAAWMCDRIKAMIKKPVLITTFFLVLIMLPIRELIALHPYQMTYFNCFSGGLSKSWYRYETDYWTSSYKEAAEWINKQADIKGEQKMVIVIAANSLNRMCAEYFLHTNIDVNIFFSGKEQIPETFDYYVSTTRYGLHRRFPELPVVHSIGRNGAIFCVIKAGPR